MACASPSSAVPARHLGRLPRVAATAALLAALGGCAGAPAQAPGGPPSAATGAAAGALPDPGFGHVHGLGVNPADGTLYAATHYGVWRVPEQGQPTRVADRYQDTMGFAVAGPDRFLGSGHPDLREDLPARLGLVESRDRGQTWQSLSLLGEADLHAIEAKHGNVYAYDATSGTLLVSRDGRSWDRRARLPLLDLAVDPGDPQLVLATAERGLLASRDGGRRFDAIPGAPRLALVDWGPAGLCGVAADGAVWASPDGASWERRGQTADPATALTTAADGAVYLATAAGLLVSRDRGRTFAALVGHAPPAPPR